MSFVIKTGKTVDEAVESALKELRLKRDQVEIEVLEQPSKGFLGLIGGKEATVKVSEIQNTEDLLKEILQDDFSETKKKNIQKEKPLKREKMKKETVKEKVIEKDIVKETPVIHEPKEVKEIDEKVYLTDEEQDKKIEEYIAKIMKSLDLDYQLEITRTPEVIHVNLVGAPEKMGIVIGKRGVTLDAIQYLLSLIVNKNRENYIRVSLDSSGYREKREETLRNLAQKMAKKVLKTSRSIRLEPMNAAERRIIHSSLQDFNGVSTHSEGREPYRKVVIHKERNY
ncbi:MAG: RNA-binding cell elongation regulator Jag/EloR [Tissierellia bacterium]|nr:RNA-binding cell elongation regulator Jag/EloR [Tissierellia bacterium]